MRWAGAGWAAVGRLGTLLGDVFLCVSADVAITSTKTTLGATDLSETLRYERGLVCTDCEFDVSAIDGALIRV